MNKPISIDNTELGKKSEYDAYYNPGRLYPISRVGKREEIGIDDKQLPFYGYDCWNHYEVSWLNQKGKPMVAIAELYYDCRSPCIIESKSLKLYFNSFNNSRFNSASDVETIIKKDLQERVGSEVLITITPLNQLNSHNMERHFTGESLDDLDIDCDSYTVDPNLLFVTGDAIVSELLHSDLLKSNCLVTNQPDWGSVQISYTGKKINRKGLLKYIISFRNHNEFHEQCIERIFMDIMTFCKPSDLTVYGRYTRRGGLDINPVRSTTQLMRAKDNLRLVRQ
ncbi:MAG: NADPH-dependent 7-cyano-7-deazaguanine reductase QueF [Erysipelotrichaceae bacterium]